MSGMMDSNQTASDAKVMNSTAVISKENTSHSTEDIITKETPNNLSGYNLDKVLLLFKNVLKISSFDASNLSEDSISLVQDFLSASNLRKIVVYKISNVTWVTSALPTQFDGQLLYLIRDSSDEPISESNFSQRVQYGKVSQNVMENLLQLIHNVYVPIFLDNKKWPDSVRKEFNNQIHKFMAFLTDTTYQLKSHTVLYIPDSKHITSAENSKSKDVIQRLESLVIHWARQINEVINTQHTSESFENSGPLFEIDFWRSRCEDLSGISDQLAKNEVKRIINILDNSKSSYLEQFIRLCKLIEDGTQEARENLRFLSILTDPCQDLAKAEPKEIPEILPKILRKVRLIWTNSIHYNSKERLTSLLRKVSNEIMIRCCAKISLDEIFSGNVQDSLVSLQDCIKCGESWKSLYKKTSQHIFKSTKKSWNFDQSSIFAQIDAFVQRCRDLIEVCEGQVQFARRLPNGQKMPIPFFGGSRGAEIIKR
jgi:dynein heavy chain